MPGTRCAVAVCNNCIVKTRLSDGQCKIVYHRFPKDEQICKQWIQKCKRNDKFNYRTSSICSDHFTEDDYQRDLKAELLKLQPNKKLNPFAVPSLNLHPIQKIVPQSSSLFNNHEELQNSRKTRREGREGKKIVAAIINQYEVAHSNIDNSINSTPTDLANESTEPTYDRGIIEQLNEKISSLENKLELNAKVINKLKKENFDLKRKCQKTMRTYDTFKKVLQSTFTDNQIKLLLGRKKQVKWTNEDISLAFTLRYLSKRCFLFMKRKMNIPLPGLSTLQRWASTFEMRKGLLGSVFNFLEVAKSTLKEHERIVVLQFDEMKVKSVLEYDKKNDDIVGPHSYMQVVIARGLFSKWKQPVYVEFDKQMTKDILVSIIHKMYLIGYTVKACVSDMGGGNIGLWKELNINIDNTFFNPSSDGSMSNVYVFADAPHTLKLIRNWLLDTGFNLSNGDVVNKEPIKNLIKLEENVDLKTAHRLTEKHINVERTQRQNVRKASQLLSHTTAAALKYNFPNDKTALSTSEFIELTNQWYDIMNSYVPKLYGQPFERAYGLELDNQDKILDSMLETIKSMRCSGKKCLQLFQKGCLISINSLKSLYKELKETYKVDFILTHRLNQDSIENLFSQIRTRGGLNDHPSPMEALYRIRMIILGKTQGVLQNHTNAENVNQEEDSSEFIVSKVLKATGIKLVERELPDDENFNIIMEESQESTCDKAEGIRDLKESALHYLAGRGLKHNL